MYRAFLFMFVFLVSTFQLRSQGDEIRSLITFYDDIEAYVNKPKWSDKTCRDEVRRANKDIETGKIVFCSPFGFIFGDFRCEAELRNLVENRGMEFEEDLFSDVIFRGQTQGCYCATMNNHLAKTRGPKTRENLYKLADSLFIRNVFEKKLIVDAGYTDFRPGPNDKGPVRNYYLSLNVDSLNLPLDFKEQLQMDMYLVIEIDGRLTNFGVERKYLGPAENDLYFEQLRDHAIEVFTRTEKWNPGQIDNKPVRTKQYFRVIFYSEK